MASGRLRLSRSQRPAGGRGSPARRDRCRPVPPREARGSAAVTVRGSASVNRKLGRQGGWGVSGGPATSLPTSGAPAGQGLGLPGGPPPVPSPLRAPAGPPPPSAPPPPPVNGQRWSLNRALNHLNAICAPGPPPPSSNSRSLRHSASHRPRAAARPRSQSYGRLLKPPRRRRAPHAPATTIGRAARPDGSCSSLLPRGPGV